MTIKSVLLAAALVFGFASAASAQSTWQIVDKDTGTASSNYKSASTDKTYQTTIDGSGESAVFNVEKCASWTIEAKTVAATATVQRCTSLVDAACSDTLTADLSEGDIGYWPTSATSFVAIVGATSTDVLTLTCGD